MSRKVRPQMNKTILILTLSFFGLLIWSCSEQRLAPEYSTHFEGWMDTTSADFHGKAAMADSNKGCVNCHANAEQGFERADWTQGGTSGAACLECHSYPHSGSHGNYAALHDIDIVLNSWNLSECLECHGADFAGGRTGKSCLGCHTAEGGPTNCATCHGQPPMDDNTLPFGMPSGAAGGHQVMAVEKGYACTECHDPVTDLSHTGPLPAEVTFANASIATADDYATSYSHVGELNSGNGSCAVYCHSNGRGGPPNQPVPEWTSTMELTCTSCHSIPPISPHPQVQTCHNCHTNVDPSSIYPNQIRFINEQMHVNGIVDL